LVIVEVLLSNGRPPEANEFRARGQSDLSSGFSYDHRLAVCVLFRTHLYLDQTATETAIVVAILLTDHLFSPIGTTVKQLTFARPQLVQNPWALSFHVPPLLVPDCARGSRVIFPSGVKVILNLTLLSVAAVKGWPLKNVAWISFGDMGSSAQAALAKKSIAATTNGTVRIKVRGKYRVVYAQSRNGCYFNIVAGTPHDARTRAYMSAKSSRLWPGAAMR
jgi:hypothetical protein